MRDLRILFNAIRNFYNVEDMGLTIVTHYPFKKYKLVRPTENKKPKLAIKQVIAIRDFEAKAGSRMELARDLFMLSFYLCGMNAVDLYKLPEVGIPLKLTMCSGAMLQCVPLIFDQGVPRGLTSCSGAN